MPYLRSGLSTFSASAKTSSVVPPVWTLVYQNHYNDNFQNSFVSRQIYGNRDSNGISYLGDGFITFNNNLQSYHIICNADAQKDKYPAYNNGASYPLGAIVYGGFYGHGLFQRTGNPGNPGYPPVIGQVGGIQDSSGWTRYRPPAANRLVNDGDGFYVVFQIKPKSPLGASFNTGNTFRVGMFDSNIGSATLPQYINADNFGISNALFAGYESGLGFKGYMATFSGNAFNTHHNYKRTTLNSNGLMSSLGNYTQLGAPVVDPLPIVADQWNYLGIQVTRMGDAIEVLSEFINYLGESRVLTTTDTNPSTYNFDVFSFQLISNVCTSFEIAPFNFESFKYGFVYP